MTRRFVPTALLGLFIVLAGCADLQKPDVTKAKEAVKLPTRVAVLPFYLDVKPPVEPLQERAVDILREQFFNRFASLGYLDLDLAEVDRRLQAADIPAEEAALAIDPQRLATVLGVDGLVVGRVKEASSFKGGILTDARLGGNVKLISSLGATLWEVNHTESRQGGVLLRGGELVRALEDLNSQFKDERHLTYLKLAEEYSRKVVATAPHPDLSAAVAFATPRIEKITVQVEKDRSLRAGDQIRAEAESSSGLNGSLDLGLWRTGIPMVEVSPGRYVGIYNVQTGDAAKGVPVGVRLSDAFGLSTSNRVAGLSIDVDAAPPAPPEDVVAERLGEGRGVLLRWRDAGDAAGYAVYRSCPPGSELSLVTKVTGGSSYTDPKGPSGAGACAYQVVALDSNQNLSYPAVASWR
jgi:hypothetical protein